LILLSLFAAETRADYPGWRHSGSIFILTTPDGANLEAAASVEGFPLLVRLHKDFFDFSQAQAHGEDIRFSTSTGTSLPYDIDEWDPAQGVASIWVRIPAIRGNARQEIHLHWGKADAISESSGSAVFNESNGYLAVWHMNGPVKDEVGTLQSKDVDTTASAGVVGQGRHFAGKQGIFCGDKIAGFPTGAAPHTSEAWFRAEKPNGHVLAWGNEHAQGKVVMEYRSPPHVRMDCYFSGGNVEGGSRIPLSRWAHVVHTYQKGDSRVYVNGVLDGVNHASSPPLAIKSPARMWIGGWYNNFDFAGDIDEVRISKVARSADWVKLEYENQKPLQTLAGPVVQSGDAFSVSPERATVMEGKSVAFSALAGGARKIFWILKSEGRETVVATDRLTYTFDTGRVTGDKSATLVFEAICANVVKSRDIPIAITETIPDPVFTLAAPAAWDGRATIEVVPQITNLAAMKTSGAGELHYSWTVSDIAVAKEVTPGKLILTRAQNSGKLKVSATIDNGGEPVTQSAEIVVTEPAHDAWIARTPAKDEKPQESQFYARDDKNEGTLFYNGTLNEAADSVFLNVYADDQPYKSESFKPGADKAYAFTVKLKPGLTTYKVEFGSVVGERKTVLNTVNNLVCGDAYLIDGQSNAEATAFGKDEYTFTSPWIRSFGSMEGSPQGARLSLWGEASARSRGGKAQVGYWGMELARRLVESQKIPICIINGAVGGTRIDQHQRNPADPEDVTTIYGRLLWRVRAAGLTHGIRGVLWHQGENDQGADGPTGGFGWETYRQFFIDMAAAWKQDYPSIQHYYIFQIWPKSCAMGINGSDNRLREVQRTLPTAFSNMSIMSTLGIDPPGGCHYPPAGYAEIARLICPLVEQYNYGKIPTTSITPPDLKRVWYASDRKDEIVMEFDQSVKWDNALAGQFYLDGEKGKVASGAVVGNVVTLKLTGATAARKLTYLDGKSWSQSTLLRGGNGIAALTFCEVPIEELPRRASSARDVDRVVVMRNDDSPVSRAVANDYSKRRGVTNLLAIHCPDSAAARDKETISFAAYQKAVESPLREFLASHPSIDFIVLTKGVPIRIKDAPGRGAGGKRPSLDSFLAALDYAAIPDAITIASPTILFDRYTLAESYYAASRFVGWEDIVIGDPLCRAYPADANR
jgi:hypothetical protein